MKSVALLAALVAASLAQHWDVEKVDSAGWGASVEMRWHPDGRLFLCYSDTSGVIRLSSKDSVWSREDLPQRRPTWCGTQAFDIDPRGNIGVSYISTDDHYWYALKSDSGWTDIQTPFNARPYSPSMTTLDTAGAPAITVQLGDAFVLARMRDTAWVTCTLATGSSGFSNSFGCSALGSRADGAVWGVFWYSFSYPGKDVYGTNLYSFHVRDSSMNVAPIRDATGGAISAVSGCVDQHGSVHSCYVYWHPDVQGTYLDQTQIDSAKVGTTALKFDSLDRPQIAYVLGDGGLTYRYLDAGVWHVFDLQTRGLTALDLILDENAQPLIAYTTSAGVFLAHGVDVAGQSDESKPQAASLKPQATVVRGVLRVPVSPFTIHTSLFDMTGRPVMTLHPGANDVSRLSPGVYFVRSAVSGERSAVLKVLVVR